MLSEKTAMDYSFAVMLLAQEIPFGFEVNWSDAAKSLSDIPVVELTEEQARVLIDDMTDQRRAFFKREAEEYEASRLIVVAACDGPCDCCKEEEGSHGDESN